MLLNRTSIANQYNFFPVSSSRYVEYSETWRDTSAHTRWSGYMEHCNHMFHVCCKLRVYEYLVQWTSPEYKYRRRRTAALQSEQDFIVSGFLRRTNVSIYSPSSAHDSGYNFCTRVARWKHSETMLACCGGGAGENPPRATTRELSSPFRQSLCLENQVS